MTTAMIQRHLRRHGNREIFVAILLAFIVLCVAYNFAVPLFEGGDEGAHFLYVDYLATALHLPDLNNNNAASQEFDQSPLYYITSALIVRWFDRSDLWSVFRVNKDQGVIIHDHTDAETDFPPYGTTLAVRINRLLSTALGALTVLLIGASAHILFGRLDLSILAAAITAFNPRFIHMSSIVSNDIAVAFAGALTLFVMADMLRQSSTVITRRHYVALGACVGLAFMCKTNGLALALPATALVGLPALKRKSRSLATILRNGLSCLLGFMLVAGWYLAWCQVEYGNPLAWSQVLHANAGLQRSVPLGIAGALATVPEILATYWGVFGHGIRWAPPIDAAFIVLDVFGLIGLIVRVLRRKDLQRLGLLALTGLAAIAAFIPWLVNIERTEGSRFLAPAFAAFQLLLSIGLLEWITERHSHLFTRIAPILGAVGATAVIPLLLIPAYNVPRYLSLAEELALPTEGRVQFDNGIELAHASVSTNRLNPGEVLTITAYWRATRLIDRMSLLTIDVRNQSDQSIIRTDFNPLNGRLNTSQWGNGILRDEYHLLAPSVEQQTVARIFLSWHEYDAPYTVAHLVSTGAVSAQIAKVKIRGALPTELVPSHSLSSTFGGIIGLEGYDLVGERIRLYWRSLGSPDRDYTVFVHALDRDDQLLGQSDKPTDYPTSLWDPREQIIQDHMIKGLSTAAGLSIGLYDSATGVRLPVLRADRTAWRSNELVIKR